MKKEHFYTHLIDLDALYVRINALSITPEEKTHLISLVDSHVHNTILDLILSELSEEDKKLFLTHMVSSNDSEVWDMLRKKVEGIEKKIQQAVDTLRDELHSDIDEVEEESE